MRPLEAIPLLLEVKEQFNQFRKEVDLEEFDMAFAVSFYRAYHALYRTDRKIAALRIIEALRHHAATQRGKLPTSLSQIKDLPIPNDPFTDKPFYYKVENSVATLSGPGVLKNTKHDNSLTYHIKIRKDK